MLKLKCLEDLFISEILASMTSPKPDESSPGEHVPAEVASPVPSRFVDIERSFAFTYLVGLLAKFELAVPLDSQHLLIPTLLPAKWDSRATVARQVSSHLSFDKNELDRISFAYFLNLVCDWASGARII